MERLQGPHQAGGGFKFKPSTVAAGPALGTLGWKRSRQQALGLREWCCHRPTSLSIETKRLAEVLRNHWQFVWKHFRQDNFRLEL